MTECPWCSESGSVPIVLGGEDRLACPAHGKRWACGDDMAGVSAVTR